MPSQNDTEAPIRVLLVDDDRETYLIVRHLLASINAVRYELDWVADYKQGLRWIEKEEHDVYLIDYRLDPHTGIELIQQAREQGMDGPFILFSGVGTHETDVRATHVGAADYLVKDQLTASILERSIRYARERQRLIRTIEERADQLRALAAQLTYAEQQERRRIVRLLHDHFQQMLVAAKMRVGLLPREEPDRIAAAAAEINELLEETLTASRTLIVELSPPVLYESGLTTALQWLARWMGERHGMAVKLELDATAEPVSEATRIFLFHAAREALFNTVKHAGVDHAQLTLTRDDEADQVRLTISDEGRGFDPSAAELDRTPQYHFGLFSIRERLNLLGGQMHLDTAPGQGTRILLAAPLQELDTAPGILRTALEEAVGTSEVDMSTGPSVAQVKPGEHPFTTRVLLADDHRIMREGLVSLLEQESDIEVVGEAGDGLQAVELAEQLHPDVVVMDVTMPHLTGIEATRQIRGRFPDVRIIGLSIHEEHEMAAAMKQAGATYYLTKGGPSHKLLSRIRGQADTPATNGSEQA